MVFSSWWFYLSQIHIPPSVSVMDEASPSADIEMLLQRVQEPIQQQAGGSQEPADNRAPPESSKGLAELPSPPTKVRRVLGTNKLSPTAQKPDFQDVAIGFLTQLKENRQRNENPHMNYALTIAERLQQIQSLKRVTILKHKLDGLIYEALLEEMPDN